MAVASVEGQEVKERKSLTPSGSRLVTSSTASADGKTLVSGSENGILKIWDLPETKKK